MPMKTSNLVTRLAMAVLLLGVLAYFGVYIYRSCTGGLITVQAYEETVDIGARVTGLVVRQEQVLTASGAGTLSVELVPGEGEKVAGGGTVAVLYASSAGQETGQTVRALEAEVEQLEYVRSSADATDTTRTEDKLLAAMAGLRASVSAGDLTGLEGDALQLRTLVLRQGYSRSGAASAGELDTLILRKNQQLRDLRASLGAVTTVVRAPQAGVFSAVADGYEEILTPALLDTLTPSQLVSLERQEVSPPADAVGALVTSSTWYFAASAPEEEVGDLEEGGQYTVSFRRDYAGQVPMTLERISSDGDGSTLLVFSSRTGLSGATLLRRQTADIVTRSLTGIRIPRSALRVMKKTETATETDAGGQERTVEKEVTVTGVYTVPSRQAEFTPVTVLYQGEDYFLVAPADPDAAHRLRAGDEIMIYTAGITDGKVVR